MKKGIQHKKHCTLWKVLCNFLTTALRISGMPTWCVHQGSGEAVANTPGVEETRTRQGRLGGGLRCHWGHTVVCRKQQGRQRQWPQREWAATLAPVLEAGRGVPRKRSRQRPREAQKWKVQPWPRIGPPGVPDAKVPREAGTAAQKSRQEVH